MLNKFLSNNETPAKKPESTGFNNSRNLTRKFLKNYLERAGNLSALQFIDKITPLSVSADESEILEAIRAIRKKHAQITTAQTSNMPLLKGDLEKQVQKISNSISGINFFLGIAPTTIKKLSDIVSKIELNNQKFSDQQLRSVVSISAFDHLNEEYDNVYEISRQLITKDQMSLLVYDKAFYQCQNIYLAFKKISQEMHNILDSANIINQNMISKITNFQNILQKQLKSPWLVNRFSAEINNTTNNIVKILDNLIFILKVNKGSSMKNLEASVEMPDKSIKTVNSKIFESIDILMEYQYHKLLNNFPLKQQVILLAQQKVIKIFLGQYLDNYQSYRQQIEPEDIISVVELLNKWYFTDQDNTIYHQIIQLENITENKQQIIFKYLPNLTYWLQEFISKQRYILDPQNAHPLNNQENNSQLTSRLKKAEYLLWLLSDDNQNRRDRLERGLSQLSSILSYDTYGQEKPIRALVAIAQSLQEIYPNISSKLKRSINNYYKKRINAVIRLIEKIKPSSSSIIEGKSDLILEHLADFKDQLIHIIQEEQVNAAKAIETLNNLIKVFSSAEYAYSLSHPFSDNFEFNTRIMEDILQSIEELSLNLTINSGEQDRNNIIDYLSREKIDTLLNKTVALISNYNHSYIPISNSVVNFISSLRRLLPPISFSIGIQTKQGELNLNGEKLTPDISKLYLQVGKIKIPQFFFRKLLIDKAYRKFLFNQGSDISTSIRDNIMTDIKNHGGYEMMIQPITIQLPDGTKLNSFIVSDQ